MDPIDGFPCYSQENLQQRIPLLLTKLVSVHSDEQHGLLSVSCLFQRLLEVTLMFHQVPGWLTNKTPFPLV